MNPSEEEVGVWVWTEDYDMIVVEGSDLEPLYGLQNRHTGVIEVQEAVFSNAVTYLIDIQAAYESAQAVIDENGAIIADGYLPVTIKKENFH